MADYSPEQATPGRVGAITDSRGISAALSATVAMKGSQELRRVATGRRRAPVDRRLALLHNRVHSGATAERT